MPHSSGPLFVDKTNPSLALDLDLVQKLQKFPAKNIVKNNCLLCSISILTRNLAYGYACG